MIDEDWQPPGRWRKPPESSSPFGGPSLMGRCGAGTPWFRGASCIFINLGGLGGEYFQGVQIEGASCIVPCPLHWLCFDIFCVRAGSNYGPKPYIQHPSHHCARIWSHKPIWIGSSAIWAAITPWNIAKLEKNAWIIVQSPGVKSWMNAWFGDIFGGHTDWHDFLLYIPPFSLRLKQPCNGKITTRRWFSDAKRVLSPPWLVFRRTSMCHRMCPQHGRSSLFEKIGRIMQNMATPMLCQNIANSKSMPKWPVEPI